MIPPRRAAGHGVVTSRAFVALSGLLALAACAEPPPSPPGVAASGPVRPETPPPAPFSPEAAAENALPAVAGAPEAEAKVNDPSAPADTPLCGRAARERIADDAAIEPDVIEGAGACAETACFDPATDTFIGADGYRHVCQ